MRRLPTLALLSLACLAAGCSRPEAPPHDVQPDPQASTAPAAPAQPGSLREAIQQPIDEAKDIRAQTEQSGTDQRKAIDDATGG